MEQEARIASGSRPVRTVADRRDLPPKPSVKLTDNVPYITDVLDRLTATAAEVPTRSDLLYHRTLDRKFARELDQTSGKLLGMTERLMAMLRDSVPGGGGAAGGKGKGKGKGKIGAVKEQEDVTDDFKKTVGEALNHILEDADAKLDEASGAIKAAKVSIDPVKLARASEKLPGPFASSSAAGSSKFGLPNALRLAEMPKPQLLFPDQVDNTPFQPWKPTLTDKAHAMVPLDHSPFPTAVSSPPRPPVHVDSPPTAAQREQLRAYRAASLKAKRDARARAHPYWYETQHLPYPTHMFQIAPPIPPVGMDNSAPTWVDTKEVLDEMVETLKGAREIAVDLEYHGLRSYYGFVCLMQVSTRERDWVVDTLKLRGELREGKLGGVMADPNIVKVFHGADSDMVWFQQDFDIYIVNLFDTFHATHVLGYTAHSLASLLTRFANYTTDKRYQMADWRIRPIPAEMLQYARADTHFLLWIYDHLRNALLAQASRPPSPEPAASLTDDTPRTGTPETNPQRAIRSVLELSAETALKLHEKDDYDPVTGRGTAGWMTGRNKYMPKAQHAESEGLVFVRVHQWRDRKSRELDESPHYFLPNDSIKAIAVRAVLDLPGVQRLVSYRPMGAREHAPELLQVALAAREEAKTMTMKQRAELLRVNEPTDRRGVFDAEVREAMAAVRGASSAVAAVTPEVSAVPKPAALGLEAPSVPSGSGSRPLQMTQEEVWDLIPPYSSGPGRSSNAAAKGAPPNARATGSKGSAMFGKTLKTPVPAQGQSAVSAQMAGKDALAQVRRKKISAFLGRVAGTDSGSGTSKSTGSHAAGAGAGTGAGTGVGVESGFENVRAEIELGVGNGLGMGFRPALPSDAEASVSVRPSASATEGAESAKEKAEDAVIDVAQGPAPGAQEAAPAAIPVSATPSSSTSGLVKDAEGVVRVKKAKAKAKAKKAQANKDKVAASVSGESAGLSPKAKAKAGPKKPNQWLAGAGAGAGAAPSDKPEFDYSLQPDLLAGQSQTAGQGQGDGVDARQAKKKAKRAKRDAPPTTIIETPDFGPRPKDMTQPKAGAQSRTFAQ